MHDPVHRGPLIDGQRQPKMTCEGLRQGDLCGVGQDSNSHLNALHTKEGHTVRAGEKHWRWGRTIGNNRESPGKWVALIRCIRVTIHKDTYKGISSFPQLIVRQTPPRRLQWLDVWHGTLFHKQCSVLKKKKKEPKLKVDWDLRA